MRHSSRSVWCLVPLFAACMSSSADPSVGPRAAALSKRCRDPHTEPPAARSCLFGEQFSDIRNHPALQLEEDVWIRSPEGLDAVSVVQLVRAVQQSSHRDVTTAGEALSRVDQQEVRRIDFQERASGRLFVVFEYGAGDNSYGAVFERHSAEVVASIHDGDLLDCTITASAVHPAIQVLSEARADLLTLPTLRSSPLQAGPVRGPPLRQLRSRVRASAAIS